MLEITVKYVDGVQFIDSVKVTPPKQTLNGVEVEYVEENLIKYAKPLLTALGYKPLRYSYEMRSYVYVRRRHNLYYLKLVEFILRLYYRSIWWSYDNLRLFKQIPPGTRFSWRYLTAYQHLLFIGRTITDLVRKIKAHLTTIRWYGFRFWWKN